MLRIEATTDETGTTLRVSGRLGGPALEELDRSFAAAAGPVVVDISDVTFVSTDGVRVLRALIARGATVRGCPLYLVPQLHGSVTP